MSGLSPMGLSLRGVGYRYPSGDRRAVAGVSAEVAPGEVVLLTGPTGCGKSTLIRLAAGLLQRHGQGDVEGEVRVAGEDPAATPPARRARLLGFVSQEPGDQLVAGTVGDELAFGMESAGFTSEVMGERLPRLLAEAGLAVGLDRDTAALSGGQTQRLTTAAALAAGAGLLLLDEPLAQLDPAGAAALVGRLRDLAASGVAVVVVEHRLEACLPGVDRVLVMDEGRLVADLLTAGLTPGSEGVATLRRLGLTVPGLLDLADRLAPADPAAARFAPAPEAAAPTPGPPVVAVSGARWRYPRAEEEALKGVTLSIREGERVALVGGNGAGKSTLLRVLADAAPGRAVAVPQDPDLALFCATVRGELAYGPSEARLGPEAVAARVAAAAEALSVSALLERSPQALSRGQRLRVAVAAALSCEPVVLLLDEPTSGQDAAHVEAMMRALSAAGGPGALIFATHDLDLALRHATRVIALDDGRIADDGAPGEVLRAFGGALPPLAAWCLGRGLAPATAAELAARALPIGPPAGPPGEGT